jgi:hypothetical protein
MQHVIAGNSSRYLVNGGARNESIDTRLRHSSRIGLGDRSNSRNNDPWRRGSHCDRGVNATKRSERCMKLSNSTPTIEPALSMPSSAPTTAIRFRSSACIRQGEDLVVRTFRPGARAVEVREARTAGRGFVAMLVHPDGFFEARLEGVQERFAYVLHFTSLDGHEWIEHDPYSFGTILGPLDLHLFGEGQHWQLYEKLGAHLTEVGGIRGTSFHVWAPKCRARQRRWRLQRLGRTPARHAQAPRLRRLGNIPSRCRRRRALQV